MKTYILDTNKVIKIWKDTPYLFDLLDNSPDVIYKITNDSICELTRGCGELEQFFPKVSDKYKRILKHIINNPSTIVKKPDKENRFITKVNDEIYFITGNMISSEDYSTIILCRDNPNFILVTDDKKMFKSGKLVLQNSQLMNYDNFIEDLTKRGINK
jgi:hypothetical protein